MSCEHSPFGCSACRSDEDGIEYGRERIPESTAATASVLLDALSRSNELNRDQAGQIAVLKREVEELREQLKKKSRRQRRSK